MWFKLFSGIIWSYLFKDLFYISVTCWGQHAYLIRFNLSWEVFCESLEQVERLHRTVKVSDVACSTVCIILSPCLLVFWLLLSFKSCFMSNVNPPASERCFIWNINLNHHFSNKTQWLKSVVWRSVVSIRREGQFLYSINIYY